jgi:hypothetical protein
VTPSLSRAREAVEAASETTDDATVREQLVSIDAALETIADDAPPDPSTEGDRLGEIERQLVDLGDETDGATHRHVETARDHLDAFRRTYAPDWESDDAPDG